MISQSSSSSKGNICGNQKSFHDAIMAAVVDTPSPEAIESSSTTVVSRLPTSKRCLKTKILADAFNIPHRTFRRKVARGAVRRHEIKNSSGSKFVWKSFSRKGYSKITADVKRGLDEWIFQHPNVIKI